MAENIIIPYEGSDDINIKYKEFNNCYLQKHWHRFFEIEFFLSGNGIHNINGKPYPIRAGEMHLMKLTDIHEFNFENDCRLYVVQFPAIYLTEDINSVILNCDKDMLVYFEKEEFQKAEFLFKLLMEEKLKSDSYNDKIIKSVITSLVLMFFRKLDVDEKSVNCKSDNRMNSIITYIQSNFQNQLSLGEVAEEFYMNSEYFSRYFKKHMGISLKEYLSGIRLDYAKKLVCDTQMKVLDICMTCGYNSMTTFLRDFENRYKCTPKQMRNHKYISGQNILD